MNRAILFLDLATTLGWAEGEPGERAVSGSIRLAPPSSTTGHVLSGFLDFIVPRMAFKPARIVYESPFSRGQDATRRAYALAGMTEMIGYRYGVRVVEANLNTIRKQVLGFVPRGDGVKESVISHVKTLGYTPADDNDADALLGWLYACTVLDPNSSAKTTPLFQNA